jgi:branched-chain amino acid transport system ATP-binding protein
MLLEIEDCCVSYGQIAALRGVSLGVPAGGAVALLGANGAGKSTLMQTVIGLLRPRAGRIRFAGDDITALPAATRARLGLGYCPEGRRVFPGLSIRDNLLVACWAGRAERARRLEHMFTLFPALGERPGANAWQLSGGQQQMLAIGRSLMNAPRLLLLDEPSLGLSPRLTEEVLGRIPQIVDSGTAVLLAEQNAARALSVCGHGSVLRLGEIVLEGPASELAASPDIRRAFLGG